MTSKASIMKHPVHPMLVPFVIAFFILALIFDVIYKIGWASHDLVQFSYYLIIGGVTMALLAVIPAVIDYHTVIETEDAVKVATSHATLNSVVLVLEVVNLIMRARRKSHFWKDGWVLSLVSVLLLAVSGWLGQQLVYVHGVGVGDGNRYYGR